MIRAWLGAVREQTRDLATAAEDATRRLGERVLSRGEARRRIEVASHAIEDLLEAADRGVV